MKPLSSTIHLRDYQKDMIARIFQEWEKCQSVMVQMPTGTGKTQVLASIVNELIAHNEQAITNIWIVAHRREWVEEIEESVARCGVRNESGVG